MKRSISYRNPAAFPLKMSSWWILFLARSVNDGAGTWIGCVMKEFLLIWSRENCSVQIQDFHSSSIWNGHRRAGNSGKKSCWNTYAKSWSIVSNSSNRKLNGLLGTTSPAYTEHTGMPWSTKSKKKAGEYSRAQQGIMHDTVTVEGCRNIRYVSIYLYMHIIHPSTKITNFSEFSISSSCPLSSLRLCYADKLKRYCA